MVDKLSKLLEFQRMAEWVEVVELAKQLLSSGYQPPLKDDVGVVAAIAADAYVHLSQLVKAHETINRARDGVMPGTSAEAYSLAVGVTVLCLRGLPEKAVSWGMEFLEKLPRYPERAHRFVPGVCHDMAYAFRRMGQFDQAMDYLRRASDAAAAAEPHRANYFRVVEAEICLDAGDITAAQRILDGIDANAVPDQHRDDYYAVKGRLAEAQGNHAEAATCGMRALAWCNQGQDGAVWAYLLLSGVLASEGHAEEAKRLSQQAAEWAIQTGREDLYKVAAEHLGRQEGGAS